MAGRCNGALPNAENQADATAADLQENSGK